MQMPTRGKGPNSYIARVPLDSSAPTSTTSGFIAWFESFCAQRGVAQLLRLQQPHPGNADSMTLTYSYIPNEGRDSCPGYSAQFIVPMYHGTTFYGICMILACGGLIDATGVDLGTTFLAAKGIDGDVNGQAFIYLTPNYNTAKGYATPQNVFGDGCLHSVTLEMCVNQKGVKHARKHAGNAPSAVSYTHLTLPTKA